MTELDILEVFNAVGASLLKEALEPAAVGTATVVPQDHLPRLKDDETGVIPAIAVDRMGFATKPMMQTKYPRRAGNDTKALHD